jgi:hypothetical protein
VGNCCRMCFFYSSADSLTFIDMRICTRVQQYTPCPLCTHCIGFRSCFTVLPFAPQLFVFLHSNKHVVRSSAAGVLLPLLPGERRMRLSIVQHTVSRLIFCTFPYSHLHVSALTPVRTGRDASARCSS